MTKTRGRPRKYFETGSSLRVRRPDGTTDIYNRKRFNELLSKHHTMKAVAEQESIVHTVLSSNLNRLGVCTRRPLAPTRRGVKPQVWTDEEILDCLREAAAACDGPLTSHIFDRYGLTHNLSDGRPWPSAQQPRLRFGTWRKACAKAGVESKKPVRKHYTRNWTRADLEAAVTRYATKALAKGVNPTCAGYDEWHHSQAGAPSLSQVRASRVDIVAIFNRMKRQERKALA